jgi:hypothetical protein
MQPISFSNGTRPGRVSLGLLAAVGAVLILAGAAAGIYFHFVVNLRLPQERDLHLLGKTFKVRVESCNNAVVKYTLLTDGTTRYAAIAKLSQADQDLFAQLEKTLVLDYPFEMPLDLGDGNPLPARIDGHNDDWVKFTLLTDHSTHYLPMTSLAASDQLVVQNLRGFMECSFPLVHVMTNQRGESLPATIVGRTADLVKFKTDDGMNLYYPINDLAPVDQKLMQMFLTNASFGTHSECLLTDKAGRKLNVRLEGRSVNIVQYTLLSDGLSYYLPIEDLSARDQQLVRNLPARMNFTFPLDYNLTDSKGNLTRVRLEGRMDNIVKFTLLADGRTYYLPMSSFAPGDQNFLQLLPTNLKIEFPLSYVLVAQSGGSFDARVMGRNADSVNFQLADGKTYVYPLAKLSPASQEFLMLLPANLADSSLKVESALPPPDLPAAPVANSASNATLDAERLTGMRTEMGSLIHNAELLQKAIDSLRTSAVTKTTSQGDSTTNNREVQLAELEDNDDKIESLCKDINGVLPKDPKSKASTLVQSWWSQVMLTVKHDDQIHQEITTAGSGERQSLVNELRDGQKSLISFLERINSQSGQYTP